MLMAPNMQAVEKNEKATLLLDQERKRIEQRIGELAGRDAALKGIEGAYVIVRGAGGVVVVPKQVAKFIGIGPGTPLRMQVDGSTVRYSKA